MAQAIPSHPSAEQLSHFGLGRLPDAEAEAVARHLEQCPACSAAAQRVAPDSFVGRVRKAGPVTTGTPAPPGTLSPSVVARQAGKVVAPPKDVPAELVNHPKYQVMRELGRGGMGVVYQARQTVMNRQVVIKVINRALLNRPESLERFHREVQAAAQLSHPNIVTAYDAEQAGELHMLVMEFVPGQSLAEVLEKKGPLPVAHACHYMRQVALGLQHAHERGMVHRDIKPGNIMLMPKNQVKILDFGLAKMVSERRLGKALTASDSYMGTPDYSAPEQATDARTADIRADLYSLGCTLYCLLAGRPPFEEDTPVKTILAHLEKQPRPLPELRPDVPAALWQVVSRLLAKNPAQRYRKPVEVAQALLPFIKLGAQAEVPGKPASLAAKGSAGKATAIAANTGEIRAVLRAMPVKTPAGKAPGGVESESPFAGLADATVLPRKGVTPPNAAKPAIKAWYQRWQILTGAGSVLLLLAFAGLWAAGVFGVKVKTADGTIVLDGLPDGAEVTVDGKIVYVKTTSDDKPVEIRAIPGRRLLEVKKAGIRLETREVTLTDGERKPIHVRLEMLAGPVAPPQSAAGNGKMAGKQEEKRARPPLPRPADAGGVGETPVPPRTALAKPASPRAVENMDKAPRINRTALHVLDKDAGPTRHLLFTPSGSRLIGAINKGQASAVRVWSVESGEQVRVLPFKGISAGWPQGLGLSPDGRVVAASTSWDWGVNYDQGQVFVWDLASARRLHNFHIHGDRAMRAVGFAKDGRTLYAARSSAGIHSWSLPEGTELKTVDLESQCPTETPFATVFTSDCRYVLGGKWNGEVCLWDRATGKPVKLFTGHTKVANGLAMSKDGTRILSCAGDFSVRMWDAESGRALFCLDNLDANVLCVAFSPDGTRFLTGGQDGVVRLRDSKTGKELTRYLGHMGKISCVVFSPNGEVAASAGEDNSIRIWKLISPPESGQLSAKRPDEVQTTMLNKIAAEPRAPQAAAGQPDKLGFVPLFDGKSLNGWKHHASQPGNWRVENGVLVGTSNDVSHLYTVRGNYTDFDLRLEARVSHSGGDNVFFSSGVYFRAPFGPTFPENNPRWLTAYNAKIDVNRLGGLLIDPDRTLHRTRALPFKPGKWLKMEIIAEGKHITIKVNGETTIDFIDNQRRYTKGYIALQQHGSATIAEFRNIEIKELAATKPNSTFGDAGQSSSGKRRLPAKRSSLANDPGFASLFDGKTTHGWRQGLAGRGQPTRWVAQGGALVSLSNGRLYTRKSYRNFELRAKVQLEAGAVGSIQFRTRRILQGADETYRVMLHAKQDYREWTVGSITSSSGGTRPVWRTLCRVDHQPLEPEQWHGLDLLVKGWHFVVKIDGQTVADTVDERHAYAHGAIALQRQAQIEKQIRFKDIEIRKLPPD